MLRGLLFPVESGTNPVYLAGRALLLLFLAGWGWKFITASVLGNYVGQSFMHNINLPFHEAGHILFSPFGRFMQVLGGTLGQILMPCMHRIFETTTLARRRREIDGIVARH